MSLEAPFEFLQRSRHNRAIVPPRSHFIQQVFDFIKDLAAFIGDLDRRLLSFVRMDRVRSLQCLSDLFEH